MKQSTFNLLNACLCEGFTNQQMTFIDAEKDGVNTKHAFFTINEEILYGKYLLLYLTKDKTYPFIDRLNMKPNTILSLEDSNMYINCYKI